jgi:alpha-1,2-rhamnosyltransferase
MIYFDVTETLENRFNTGIQRVVRSLGRESLKLQVEFDVVIKLIAMNPITREFELIDERDFFNQNRELTVEPRSNLHQFFTLCRPFISGIKLFLPKKTSHALKLMALRKMSKGHSKKSEIFSGSTLQFTNQDLIFTADSFWNNPILANLLCKLARDGISLHVFVHDVLPLDHPEFFEKSSVRVFKKYFVQVIRKATQIYTSSNHVRSSFIRRFPEHKLVTVIDLGSDLPDRPYMIVNQNLQSEPIKMIAIGTIEPRKNYDQILNWLSMTSTNTKLQIVGRAGWKSSRLIRRLKNNPNVELLGVLSDAELSSLLQVVHIGVCASFDEGYGLPLREFLGQGLPVIASDIPPFRENIDTEKVFYFELGNLDSFENAVICAISAPGGGSHPFPTWEDTARQFLTELSQFQSEDLN